MTKGCPKWNSTKLTLPLVWERVRKCALSAGLSPSCACHWLLPGIPSEVKVCDTREEAGKELPTSREGCLYEASVRFPQCQK